MITLDYSLTGWKAAVREFLISLVKTMAAAGITYVISILASLDVTTVEYGGLVMIVRAVLTSALTWLTTVKPVVVADGQVAS